MPIVGVIWAIPLCAQDGYAPTNLDDDEANGIDLVAIRHFRLEPYANLSFLDDLLLLHPKAIVGLNTNDNLYQTNRDLVADSCLNTAVALDCRYELDEASYWQAGVEGWIRDYFTENDRDMIGLRGTFDYHQEGQTWEVDGHAFLDRVDDPLVETGRDVLVQTYGGLVDVAYAGNLTKVGFGIDCTRVDYLEDSDLFYQDERDRLRYGASIFAKRQVGVDSNWETRGSWFHVNYDASVDPDRAAKAGEAVMVEIVDNAILGFSTWYYNRATIALPNSAAQILEQLLVHRIDLALPGYARLYYSTYFFIDRPPTDEEILLAIAQPLFAARPGSRALYEYYHDVGVLRYQDSNNLRLVTGGRYALTDRLRLTGDIGVELRDFDGAFDGNTAYDDRLVWSPVGEVSLRWHYAETGTLKLQAYYRLFDGAASNVSSIGRSSLEWEHRLPSRIDFFGELAWVDRVDSGADTHQRTYRSHTASAKLGLGYRCPKGFSVRLFGEYRIFGSNLPDDDYKQFQAQLELAAIF